ncbi:MAG: DUF397 domain-containing protein [Actinomycetota bacterium]
MANNDGGWKKSSFSDRSNCVEWRVDANSNAVHLRNSNRPEECFIEYTFDEWAAFIEGAKNGEADI